MASRRTVLTEDAIEIRTLKAVDEFVLRQVAADWPVKI